jgi:hypothetical protein
VRPDARPAVDVRRRCDPLRSSAWRGVRA